MPSKTSNKRKFPPFPKRDWLGCTETGLEEVAEWVVSRLGTRDVVLLDGEMGAGKSTLARAILRSVGVDQPPEGSPTFALVHEYSSPKGAIAHMDLFRIRAEEELDESGITAIVWERNMVSLVEWASLWPQFEESLVSASGGRKIWRIAISLVPGQPERRDIRALQAS